MRQQLLVCWRASLAPEETSRATSVATLLRDVATRAVLASRQPDSMPALIGDLAHAGARSLPVRPSLFLTSFPRLPPLTPVQLCCLALRQSCTSSFSVFHIQDVRGQIR
jgi:hypothetical protein